MPCFATFMLSKGKNQNNLCDFMILNKFRPDSVFFKLRTVCLQLLALSLFSCNKTANISGNKAFVALTHVAYGVGSLNLFFPNSGDSLLPARISFGNTSGIAGNPYDTATSRISDMQLIGDTLFLTGNAGFQQGTRYSVFAYDSGNAKSIALLILQDNLTTPRDTLVNFRFMNFSPGSQIGLRFVYIHDTTIFFIDSMKLDSVHIAVRDTVDIPPSLFVGYNPDPPSYKFNYTAHIGANQVFAFEDTSIRKLDPVQFDSTKTYNIYLQGYFHPTPLQDSLKLMSVRLN
jgi:hypothetical protein